MTSRDRILAAVNHKPLDRIPTDMWATPEVQESLFDYFNIHFGKESQTENIGLLGGYLSRGVEALLALWDELGIDGIIDVRPPYTGSKRYEKNGIVYNEWGFGYKSVQHSTGTYAEQVVFPLANVSTIQELDDFCWPDPEDYDYDALADIIEKCGGRATSCGYHALFTYHQYLRGLELNLMDPIISPDFTKVLVKKISDFFIKYHSRCFKAAKGKIDFTQVTDDWGSQNGLIASPIIFGEFYKKEMQRGIDLAKSHHIKVFHHNDGDCRPLIPILVEMGIDVLNPIQWRCGNWNLKALKESFNPKICFHSAIDNQYTLPYASPDEVRDQVRFLIDTLACDDSGFIIGPCHNIQANTPIANILTMYESVREIALMNH